MQVQEEGTAHQIWPQMGKFRPEFDWIKKSWTVQGVSFIGLIKVATKMNKFATIVFKGVFYLSDKSGKKKGTNLPQ